MGLAVERIGTPGIGTHVALAVIDCLDGLVGREVGIGEFVILALLQAAPADAEPAPAAQAVALQAAAQVFVEKLVVAELIGGDLGADLLQHRLLGRILERAVIGACARLDDAACHHLAGLAAAHRTFCVERQLVTLAETRESGIEIPGRIGELRPAAERHAVLHLFHDPGIDCRHELRIVGEDAGQIDAVVAAVPLHQGRGLDVAQDLRIDLRRVEPIPGDRFECPVTHDREPSAVCRVNTIKRPPAPPSRAGRCTSGQKVARKP